MMVAENLFCATSATSTFMNSRVLYPQYFTSSLIVFLMKSKNVLAGL